MDTEKIIKLSREVQELCQSLKDDRLTQRESCDILKQMKLKSEEIERLTREKDGV